MGHGGPPDHRSRAFSIEIPADDRARLQRQPGGVLARLEAHLADVAQLAEATTPDEPVWQRLRDPGSTQIRFAMKGVFALFEVDWARRVVVVREVGSLDEWR